MNMHEEPLVTVLTPVYNGEEFLAECIDSVLQQTYKHYEYIIVNNCSTDGSLDIAKGYAAKDSRIRVCSNREFVGVIENHNLAFSLMSLAARYCKVVSADDFIFPDCIRQMVECAEANPSAGIIGSYQLSGSYIKWQGFRYPRAVIPGVELCRQIFLGGDRTFGFGTPTSLLYRADLVRGSGAFYPNPSPHADTSACFEQLQHSAFGFVYQVLSYERIHEETQSSKSVALNRYSSAYLNDLKQYGPHYLSREELRRALNGTLKDYHRFLAVNWVVGFREDEFWSYHKGRLQELGYPLTRFALLKAAVVKVLRETLNPEQLVRKAWKRVFPKTSASVSPAAQPPGSGAIKRLDIMPPNPETVGRACDAPK
jgi:glycosyltransferase involved in cell wall biosynthesis